MQKHYTLRPGKWSTPSTWKEGIIPPPDVMPVINHPVTLNTDADVCGIEINAPLTFDKLKNVTLIACDQVMVNSDIICTPAPIVTHNIFQHGIDENKVLGSTLDINNTDPGIYVMEKGRLLLKGTNKTLWTNLTKSACKWDSGISVKSARSWKVGDQLIIAPTMKGSYLFETVTIAATIGTLIILTAPLQNDYPMNGEYTAEVINITSNVNIEGQPDGRGHIMLMAGVQTMSNVRIRHMGIPSKKGRYPLHHDHNGEASRGSLYTNVLIMDSGNHGFVPHASNGITYKGCAVVDSVDSPYWYDEPAKPLDTSNSSNNIVYDTCLAALTRVADSPYRLPSFLLGAGTGNIVKNCVAVANMGAKGSAGYIWSERDNYIPNEWLYLNNLSHNFPQGDGNFNWQNDPKRHDVTGAIAYNCNNGMQLGAYTNNYYYSKFKLFNNTNGILIHALPRPKGIPDQYGYLMSFTDGECTDPVIITFHTLIGGGPILFLRNTFADVIIDDKKNGIPGYYDFVDCKMNLIIRSMEDGSLIRVQNGNVAYEINSFWEKTAIPIFLNLK